MKDSSDRNRRRRYRCASVDRDSSELFFGGGSGRRRDHKTAQLCRQVFWALSMALGDCADDVLRELLVQDVTPAPDSGRLLVRVMLSAVSDVVAVADVMARLDQATGFLRREVAAAITRKRAPELMFVLVAAGGGSSGGDSGDSAADEEVRR
jgi:ribosome-binding factor A